MKKKFIILTIAAVLFLIISVGATFAWIVATSNEVENTFTIGNVEIALTETTGTSYPMTPGTTLEKDPTVTVKAGSDACWLFVKVDKSQGFDSYFSFLMSEGWIGLDGVDGVYYRKVDATTTRTDFEIIRNDHILVNEKITEEDLAALSAKPTLSFKAYAIQQTGFSTAILAWNELNG